MKNFAFKISCFLLLVTALSFGESAGKYIPGKILDVQQKSRSEVLYYLVNTPITKDTPYFEVSVVAGGIVYETEFVPRHAADTLPEDWQIGSAVSLRAEKHYVYLKRLDGREVQMQIVKKTAEPQTTEPQ